MDSRDPGTLYDIDGSLGEGSYGAVWKATEKGKPDVPLAIKISPIEDDMAVLMTEIDILEECRDDFVVKFHGAFKKDGNIWIVMELCDAGSASDLIQICNVALNEEQVRDVCASVVLGLDYLHSKHMIHRDLKAANVLLTKDGRAKLADFGVSAKLSSATARRKTVIGTPFWMAPEVIQEELYNSKADIWSLGITLIELAEMEPPYSNIHPMRAIFMIPSRPPPKLSEPSAWSDEMNDFLALCLTKNPEDRPSARDLKKHPFIKSAVKRLDKGDGTYARGQSPALKELVEEHLESIELYRLQEEEEQQRVSTVLGTAVQNSHTAVWVERTLQTSRNAYIQTLQSTGTMVQAGTMQMNDMTMIPGNFGSVSEPTFMQYFRSPVSTVNPKADSTEIDLQDLKHRLKHLKTQFHKDVIELRRAYQKRRNALEQAAGNK